MSQIVDSRALIRLIEIELVSQYKRFLKKNLSVSPKNCRFNAWTTTESGGFIRMCRCPRVNSTSPKLTNLLDQFVDKPCTTLNHAKKCPLYQHFTGVPISSVIDTLTEDFLIRLNDPIKRGASFKVLHTLWLLLHEQETLKLSWVVRLRLKLTAVCFTHKYQRYMIRLTPEAETLWERLSQNFRVALHTINLQE